MPLVDDTQLEEIRGLQAAIADIKEIEPPLAAEDGFVINHGHDLWAKDLNEAAAQLNEILAAPLNEVVLPALYKKLWEGHKSTLSITSRKRALFFSELTIASTHLYLLSSEQPEGHIDDMKQLPKLGEGQFGLLFYKPSDGVPPFKLFTLTAHADELTPQLEEAWQTIGRVMPEFAELKELEPASSIGL